MLYPMRALALPFFVAVLLASGAASAQCVAVGPIPAVVCRGGSERCIANTDPVVIALRTAQDASADLEAVGLYDDVQLLQQIGFDGTIQCSAFSAARVDEVARHVREAAAQHAGPERASLVIERMDAINAAVQSAVQVRVNAARAAGLQVIANVAGIMDPGTAVFPTTFTTRFPRATWIVVRHPGDGADVDSNRTRLARRAVKPRVRTALRPRQRT